MRKLSTTTEIIKDMIKSLEHDYRYNPSVYVNGISYTVSELEQLLKKLN